MIGLDIILVYGFIYFFFGQTLIYSEYERKDERIKFDDKIKDLERKENKPPSYSP
tara:strand:+ start:662 stop:826 length:165 start_codon:yes stop_codon:yes gene_type:complete